MISQVKTFFDDQTVFLTGGTGFIGKVLIEKLLRECEGLKKIYILVRPKKNKTPKERLQELTNAPCFDPLKSTNINLLDKLCLLNGDCFQPSLGLSEQDLHILIKETTCFIHAAANVKFDQTLKEAAYTNIKGTQYALDLAKQMPNLKVFVFVSTLYSNCCHQHIKEEFYPPPLEANTLLSLVEDLDEDTLRAVTPTLLMKWPNTYVYSKAIAESLLRKDGQHLPITVVRPAIVVSAVKEPLVGWIDNFYGPVGLITAGSLGILKTVHAKQATVSKVVPVDYLANFILAAAWKRQSCKSTTIYNYSESNKNYFTCKQFIDEMFKQQANLATTKILWYPTFKIRKNKIWNDICTFFLHTVFAYIVDFFLICSGRSPLAVKAYRRLDTVLKTLSYFFTRNWTTDNKNVTDLWNAMNSEDQKLFNFDMDSLDLTSYAYNAMLGGRIYLIKEPIDTLPQGQRKLKLLFVAHYATVALFWYLVYKLVMFMVSLFI